MKIIPSVIIKNGFCLKQITEAYQSTEVVKKSVPDIVKNLEEQGAGYIHVTDMDGAVVGHSCNEETIRKILDTVSVPVIAGGGLRSIHSIDRMLDMGVSKVLIGTKAVQNPVFIRDALSCFGADKIVLAVDARNGMVVMEGWEKISSYNAVTFSIQMREMGVEKMVYTDVLRSGMKKGPNAEHIEEMVKKTGLEIYANGGINSMKDLELLYGIGVAGVLTSSVIYDDKINLQKANELFAGDK